MNLEVTPSIYFSFLEQGLWLVCFHNYSKKKFVLAKGFCSSLQLIYNMFEAQW